MAVALPDNLQRITEEAQQTGHAPLFDAEDVIGLLRLVEGVDYGTVLSVGDTQVTFRDAGHILGSAIVEITTTGKTIVFSGDLGNPPSLLLHDPVVPQSADYLVIESAYGDRTHEARLERSAKLAKVITKTIARQGVLLIPSFALERTQELLFELDRLFTEKKLPAIPVFLDSPLAIKLTEVYRQHSGYFNQTADAIIKSGDDIFNFPLLKLTPSVEQSKAINDTPAPKIIIAGSGMSHGGRILHHELRYLSDPNSTILFVGYQVDGSLGRHIQRGDKSVSILGQKVMVNCQLENITSYSGHADQATLLNWAKTANDNHPLEQVFVVQGEETPAKTLANLIHEQIGVAALAPEAGQTFDLG